MEKTFNYPFDAVFKACRYSLRELNMNISSASLKLGQLTASTRASIWSWGEDIEIYVKEISQNKTKVKVVSSANSQIFSWGKDSKNEEEIIETIEKYFKK